MENKNLYKIKIVLIILLVGILFIGCKNRVPRGFPKPKKMAAIVTELKIIENTMQYGSSDIFSTKDTYGYYKSTLEKYGYTYQQFDSIRKWYANHPELYQKVYAQVVVNLSKRETELGLLLDKEKIEEDEKNRLEKLEAEQQKLSELWSEADTLTISPTDTIDKRAPFKIETDTLDLTGMLRFSAQYKFLINDESKNPQMMLSAFYADSTADTLYKEIPHSFQKQSTILDFQIDENKKISNIYGYLLLQDSLVNVSVEISDISLRIINDSIDNEFKVQKDSRLKRGNEEMKNIERY